MSANQDHFGEFRDHTRLKHYILESYVARWGIILLHKGRHRTAWFIDAFAGRGVDDQGNEGSPLIAAKVARRLRDALRRHTLSPLPALHVIAIEKEKKHVRALAEAAKPFSDGSDPCLTILQGTLAEHITAIHARGQAGEPKLFFLDPFGVKGLSATILRDILSRPREEVLLLFSDTGVRRLHGAARAVATLPPDSGSPQTSFLDALAAPRDRTQPTTVVEAALDESACDDESVEASAPSPARAILQEAFGDHYEQAVEAVSAAQPARRRRVWLDEYVRALYAWGATHVLPFSVVDSEGQHRYYLIHAATHPKAIRVMKEAMNRAMLRQREERGGGPPMIYLSTVDVSPLVQALAHHFAGQEIRWQDDDQPNAVKTYLLERTQALISDFPQIQRALAQRGWVCKARPLTYRFPPNAQ